MSFALRLGAWPLIFLALGCSNRAMPAPKARLRPQISIVHVQKRTIVRITSQPGFIEAYEQTSMYAKVSGFIDEWNVDIGDTIKKGQALAHLDIPDLVAEHDEKKAEVKLDAVRVKVAEGMVRVADENWKNAIAQVSQAKALLGKYAAAVELAKVDYDRISMLVKSKSLEREVQDESYKRLLTSIAEEKAGESAVVVAQSTQAARKADVDKAQADVEAARAKIKVARGAEQRLAALVGYSFVKAPYDGVIIARNVNTGDFVQPAAGDLSGPRSDQNTFRSRGSPLYVVARTDKVRVFIDVPEMDAADIAPGNRAWVNIKAVNNIEIPAAVTRTSWALNVNSRTLRAEVDLPNPNRAILPNMYAFGKVEINRKNIWAVPLETLVEVGNQTVCYEYKDGKALVLPVQRGIDDGAWVEVAKKRAHGEWTHFDGTERIITGDLTDISDGEPVRVASPAGHGPTASAR